MLDGLKIMIKLINKRQCGGNIKVQNFVFRKIVKVLNDGSNRIAVSTNDDAFTTENVAGDVVVPVREYTFNSVFQALQIENVR